MCQVAGCCVVARRTRLDRQLSYYRDVRRARVGFCLATLLLAVTTSVCTRGETPHDVAAPATTQPVATAARERPAAAAEPTHDLSLDESMGGHTLSRHVGKTDAELRERLRAEPQISAASTWTDRATAEHAVGAALSAGGRKLDAWRSRTGRRPNLVLDYRDRSGRPVGRSLARGQGDTVSCDRAVVVLRWDDRRDRFYVLTSYPEAGR